MPDNQHSFVIPDEQSISALVSLLGNHFSIQEQAETVYHRVFYDTFDWRLYKNGSILEGHDDGKSLRIYWQADKDGKLKIQLGLKKVPRLAADLPACEFRQQLTSVISVRELLPRIKLRIKRQSFAVRDENNKIVVRLNLDEYWYNPAKLRAASVLTRRLTLKAVKGYAKDYQRLAALLADMPLQTTQDNVMELALIASGVSTGEYNTRLNLRLDPDMPDAQAVKKILLRLLEIMQQNTSGTIKGRDTEFMHDYRVVIKKIRVALKQAKTVHPQEIRTEYKSFFSQLGKLTNPVRDLDVFLLQLQKYQADFDQSSWPQLQPLRQYLLLSRAEAQKQLIAELKSSQYRDHIKQWRDYLEQSEMDDSAPDKPGRATYKLADELIWRVNQETLVQGKAITRNSAAETLHELRKYFKHLRYLIEFFRSLYPAVKLRVLIESLIDVQDSLGEYNDSHIQMAMVNAFIQQSDNQDAIKASEQMVEILQRQQLEAGKKFKESYKMYSSAGSQKKFKEMFVEYYEGQD